MFAHRLRRPAAVDCSASLVLGLRAHSIWNMTLSMHSVTSFWRPM